jgi:hypothetical protein
LKTDKKKIIFITSRSGYGGGPLHVNILIEGLKNVYDIFCAAPLSEPYGVKWLEQVGSDKFIEIPHRKFQIKYFLQLVSFIKKNQIEILHAHGKGAGLYGRLIKIFYPKIYIIFTFHGFHSGKYNTLTKKFYIILERSLNRLTNQFINVSNGEQDVCIANGIYKKSKSIVIYNALENAPTIKFDKAQLREKLALPKNEFLIFRR